MFNELYEITSIQVKGQMDGPNQVIVLELGILGDDPTYTEKKSFLLHQWSANAIADSLRFAGIRPMPQEEK